MNIFNCLKWCCFIFFIVISGDGHTQENQFNPISLKVDSINEFTQVHYLSSDLNFHEVSQQVLGWESSESSLLNLGFSPQTYWLKQTLRNDTQNAEWFLTLNNTRLDYVDFYLVEANNNVQHFLSGDYRPTSGQLSSAPTFRFHLEPTNSAIMYIRIKSNTKISFSPKIRSSFKYGQFSLLRKVMHLLYACVLMAFIIFHTLLNQPVIDKITLYYSAGLFFGFAYNFFYYGDGDLFLWPDSPEIKNYSHFVSGLLCCGFFSLFLQKYLRSSMTMIRTHKVLNGFLLFVLVSLIVTLCSVGNSVRVVLILLAAGGFALIAIFGTVRTILRDNSWGGWFAIPLLFSMLSTLAYVSTFLGFIPHTEITSTLLLWSFLFDIVLVSLSLVYRHHALRRERDNLLLKLSEIGKKSNLKAAEAASSMAQSIDSKKSNRRLGSINSNDLIVALIQFLDDEKAFLDPELNVDKTASALGVRADQLSTLISSELKTSFPILINIKRLDTAALLLKNFPDKQILSIALECGFNSKSNFNRLFKDYFGVTPSRYRKQ